MQRGASGAGGSVRSWWEGYLRRCGRSATENEALRRELGDLKVVLQQERVAAERAESFRRLLEFRARTSLATTGAEVIGTGASPEFRTVTIDKGTSDGLAANMAVLAPAGVVGRITLPSARASLVQLLIDRNAAAGALIERTRVQGVVVGVGDGTLRMDFVASDRRCRRRRPDRDVGHRRALSARASPSARSSGWTVATALYHVISVRPAVDVSRLEEVLVVLTPPPPAEGAK